MIEKSPPADGRPIARPLRPSKSAIALAGVVGALVLVAGIVGLFWQIDGASRSVQSVRGEAVELYGEGIYRYDSLFRGAGNRGSDVVSLALGLPLLAVAVGTYRRGRLSGGLLLAGGFTWFLYLYASVALGSVYNELFIIYIMLFSASLFGLVLTVTSLDVGTLGARLEGAPYRGASRLLFAGGVVTLVLWLSPLIGALLSGGVPKYLDHYTVSVTDVLDLGIITPTTLVAAYLLHRRDPRGWVVGFPLLVLLLALLPLISLQTVFQIEAGVSFAGGEIVGPIGGFLVLGALALRLVMRTMAAASGRVPGPPD